MNVFTIWIPFNLGILFINHHFNPTQHLSSFLYVGAQNYIPFIPKTNFFKNKFKIRLYVKIQRDKKNLTLVFKHGILYPTQATGNT
jgi:hypothetical protein